MCCIPPPDPEFRALFVATVSNIDWPTHDYDSVSQQQADLITILDMAEAMNFNAIMFQVSSLLCVREVAKDYNSNTCTLVRTV